MTGAHELRVRVLVGPSDVERAALETRGQLRLMAVEAAAWTAARLLVERLTSAVPPGSPVYLLVGWGDSPEGVPPELLGPEAGG